MMDENRLTVPGGSVRTARAVISTASKLLDEGSYDLDVPRRWTSSDVILGTTPLPEAGVVLTLRPRVGWAGSLRGTSVLLAPLDSGCPVRFGILDGYGQLRVKDLPLVPHKIVLHTPWWLDDHLCEEVRDGHAGPAGIAAPVVVWQLPELESELFAMLRQTLPVGDERTYLSAAGRLRYTIRTLQGELQVDARLKANDPAGQAAVCYGLLPSPSPKRVRKGICSTVFDQRAGEWWRADPMRCRSVLMLGANPQPAPGPAARRVALDPRMREALGSSWTLQRQVASAEITGELSPHDADLARPR